MPAYRSFSRGTKMALTAEAIQAREGAARAAAGFFCAYFQDRYSRTAILTALAQAAALPLTQSEHCAKMPSFLLGAALWLLDYFEQNRRGAGFLALLPLEFSEDADDQTPDADDLTHGRNMVLRLMTVLLDREGEHRRAFRKLLSLLDKETAVHLRHHFRDALLDYFGRLLKHCARAQPAASSPAPSRSPLLSPAPPRPDLTDPDAGIFGLPDGFSFAADFPGVDFLWKTPRLMGRAPQMMWEALHTRRAVEPLPGFTVEEPYALCAAYLLLEREGDALAHLNSLTAAVMYCAEAHLPWAPDLPFRTFPPLSGRPPTIPSATPTADQSMTRRRTSPGPRRAAGCARRPSSFTWPPAFCRPVTGHPPEPCGAGLCLRGCRKAGPGRWPAGRCTPPAPGSCGVSWMRWPGIWTGRKSRRRLPNPPRSRTSPKLRRIPRTARLKSRR